MQHLAPVIACFRLCDPFGNCAMAYVSGALLVRCSVRKFLAVPNRQLTHSCDNSLIASIQPPLLSYNLAELGV